MATLTWSSPTVSPPARSGWHRPRTVRRSVCTGGGAARRAMKTPRRDSGANPGGHSPSTSDGSLREHHFRLNIHWFPPLRVPDGAGVFRQRPRSTEPHGRRRASVNARPGDFSASGIFRKKKTEKALPTDDTGGCRFREKMRPLKHHYCRALPHSAECRSSEALHDRVDDARVHRSISVGNTAAIWPFRVRQVLVKIPARVSRAGARRPPAPPAICRRDAGALSP